MKLSAILLVSALAFAVKADGDVWAILIGGSDGWGNYRHQSDVSHAYQILINNGIPAERIISFQKDDIADNSRNPTPGIIINQPGGEDVYHDIVIDYAGADCTAANVLAVIRGDASAVSGGSGRVLESSKANGDRVFINYSDHGSVGLVAMPVGPYLYANDLDEALTDAYNSGLYDELLFYLEACESGSMFSETLKEDDERPIFATTAANPHQSSYAYYYDSERGTYLGDEYSIHWMESADEWDLCTKTLDDHLDFYRAETKESEVCHYGHHEKFASYPIMRFLGDASQCTGAKLSAPKFGLARPATPRSTNAERASSRDVKLDILNRQLASNDADIDRAAVQAELEAEIAHREHSDNLFKTLAGILVAEEEIEKILNERIATDEWECLRTTVEHLEDSCGRLSDYSLQYTRVLSNACEMGVSMTQIQSAIETVC